MRKEGEFHIHGDVQNDGMLYIKPFKNIHSLSALSGKYKIYSGKQHKKTAIFPHINKEQLIFMKYA